MVMDSLFSAAETGLTAIEPADKTVIADNVVAMILVLMLTSGAMGQWQFIALCLVFLLISGFFVVKGIRFIVRRWREVGEIYDFIASLSPEEKTWFDKAIASGDVRIVRGDDGKIHTEALDFG